MDVCASQVAHPPMQKTHEMWVRSLGQEDPLEEETATHSSVLAWKIPWTEEPGGLQSTGSKELGTIELAHLSLLYIHRVHAQSCLTLCNLMDCSLPGFSVHGIFPGRITGVGCHFLLQGIFPPGSPALQADALPSEPPGKPVRSTEILNRHKENK